MNDRQAKALASPMRSTPHDNQPFCSIRVLTKVTDSPEAYLFLSDILTVDDLPDEQPPRWHASAAVVLGIYPIDRGELQPFAKLPRNVRCMVRKHVAALLAGVGDGGVEWYAAPPTEALHARRPLSPAELAAIRSEGRA